MTIDEALAILDHLLAPHRLSTVQELVFRQCWAGQTYRQIAEGAGYDSDYVRVIGSRLWQILSQTLGERVTKNNVHAVLRQQTPQPFADLLYPASNGSDRFEASEVIEALEQSIAYDFPGSPIAVDSPIYVSRPPTEEQAFGAILQPGMLLRIRAPEKWGKTSLLDRVLHHAKQHEYEVVRLNFQQADGAVLENLERFLRWFCANVACQLGLKARLDDFWDTDLGSKISCTTYMQSYILKQLDRPLVIALDEVQRIFEYPDLAKDFLPMLRVWHEEAKNLKSWANLRLVVVYATEGYIPIDFHQSPFNVGFPIRLQPFTLPQTRDLAAKYGFKWLEQEDALHILARLRSLVDGHPYLLHLAFYALSRGQVMLEQLWEDAAKQNGIYGKHLRHYLQILQTNPDLAQAFRAVIAAPEAIELEAIVAHKLESMGLVKLCGDRAVPSCQLYCDYFGDRLVELDSCPT